VAKIVEITFRKLNHFWLDSGLLGLTILLREIKSNIQISTDDTGLTLKGAEGAIQDALEKAYDLLIKRYYNLSTKKQRDNTNSYNFYYDSKSNKFVAFPKKKAVGIANLIFDKAPHPAVASVKWDKKIKEKKEKDGGKWIQVKVKEKIPKGQKTRIRGILPLSHSYLQKRMDEFLNRNGLSVTTAGLLIDGENEVRPRVNIQIKSNKNKGYCYLCGEDSYLLEDAKQTTFPFITGSSGVLSFNSFGGKPEKVCWKCALLGKFVPVNGFYLSQGNNLFAFFPYSVSFEKMIDIYQSLQDAKYDDPNLYKNFQHPLGFEKYADGYFQKPFEVAFTFFYTLYDKFLRYQKGTEEDIRDFWEQMLKLTVSKASLEFVVLHAESKGNTSMGKMVWPFRDSVYFFRLMKELEGAKMKIKEVMRLLIDFSQKNENRTLIRNRVCERILKQRSILELIELHIFHTNRAYIKPLFDFVIKYEPIVRKEVDNMTLEEQNAAVTLGKRVGMVVGKNGKKGDLFTLRKARKKTDFLNEVNRLQFKYNLTVPPDVYEGKLTDSNFVEFKQFCMIAALNSFYAATK